MKNPPAPAATGRDKPAAGPGKATCAASVALELVLLAIGTWLYAKATWPALDKIGKGAFVALIAFLAVIQLANTFGAPPPSVDAVARVTESMEVAGGVGLLDRVAHSDLIRAGMLHVDEVLTLLAADRHFVRPSGRRTISVPATSRGEGKHVIAEASRRNLVRLRPGRLRRR